MEAPLVSIIVVTYNSSPFVVETLESAKVQTYKNIELIISDDCSTDDTVALCKEWLRENSAHFVRTQLITESKNTGIAGNLNRGIKASQGQWIKGLAGDDVLKDHCIDTYVRYITSNPEVRFVHAAADIYSEQITVDRFLSHSNSGYQPLHNNNTAADAQFRVLLTHAHLSAPTTFIKRDIFEEVGLYDETIPMLEDWPMWLRITRAGIRLYYLDECTINYRIRSHSLSNHKGAAIMYKSHTFDIFAAYKKYIRQYLSPFHRMLNDHIVFYTQFSYKYFRNKRNLFTRGFHFLIIKPVYLLNEHLNNRLILKYDKP